MARLFSAEVHELSRRAGWTRDEPSTADGTPIEPRASLKGFVRKDGAGARKVASAKEEEPRPSDDPLPRRAAPHVACKEDVSVPGLDGRTTGKAGCRVSPRIRKRVEEIFGWIKTVDGLRRSRLRGRERTRAWGCFVAGAHNLLRMARLELASAN